jgi:hypothetical protein
MIVEHKTWIGQTKGKILKNQTYSDSSVEFDEFPITVHANDVVRLEVGMHESLVTVQIQKRFADTIAEVTDLLDI